MSVYSYIEVLESNTESREDSALHLGFGHGIHWSYQIAVAGGKRTYQGVQHGSNPNDLQLEDITAMSIYEQPIFEALLNYHTAIGACLSTLQLSLSELDQWLRKDLELLFAAQDWFQKAWLKVPGGIVRLDWGEAIWGMEEVDVAKDDSPNDSYTFFCQLEADCSAVQAKKLTTAELVAKYQKTIASNTN